MTNPTQFPQSFSIWCIKYLTHCAPTSGGSSLLLHLVSAVAVAGADIRLLLLVLEMQAQPLEVHHLFRCLCSALQLLVVRLSNPQLHRHRRHHLCSNPAIAWFGLLARCRRVPLNAILCLQLFSFLQALQVSLSICSPCLPLFLS